MSNISNLLMMPAGCDEAYLTSTILVDELEVESLVVVHISRLLKSCHT